MVGRSPVAGRRVLWMLLAGLVAFMRLDVNNFPDIEFPAAIVIVAQPGAAPSEMENQVTQRIEAAARGLTGIEEINSSIREGNSQTFVSFQIGTPIDRARLKEVAPLNVSMPRRKTLFLGQMPKPREAADDQDARAAPHFIARVLAGSAAVAPARPTATSSTSSSTRRSRRASVTSTAPS